MIEILRARKEQLKERGVKGFTLMEMLIVIAIIAILIAIAIPIFTSQLDRANAATDAANIRSGYAQVQSEIILNNVDSGSYTLLVDGTVKGGSITSTVAEYETKGASDVLSTEDTLIGGVTATWSKGHPVTYTVAGGKITNISGTA